MTEGRQVVGSKVGGGGGQITEGLGDHCRPLSFILMEMESRWKVLN